MHPHSEGLEGLEAPIAAVIDHQVMVLARRYVEPAGVGQQPCGIWYGVLLEPVRREAYSVHSLNHVCMISVKDVACFLSLVLCKG